MAVGGNSMISISSYEVKLNQNNFLFFFFFFFSIFINFIKLN